MPIKDQQGIRTSTRVIILNYDYCHLNTDNVCDFYVLLFGPKHIGFNLSK